MKRAAASLYHSHSDGEEQPAKLRRRDSSSTLLFPSKRQQQTHTTRQPLSPLSNNNSIRVDSPERGHPTVTPPSRDRKDEIFQWIPPPSDGFEVMSQPASKRSRSRSISTDRGRPRSVSPSTSASSRDAKSYAYKAANYVTILETKGCFMRSSDNGPTSGDVDLCERLLDPSVDTPRETLFEFIKGFHDTLRNRSEARLLVDLHPLLMPSAENLRIQGREDLKDVIDGYNDPWLKTEPIYGPKPQPDHARGLKWSTFSESQRRKLGIKPDEKSLYAVREDMYFPYLTAEIKCGNQALEFADRQNMHSMCVALRAVVSLAQAAGRLEEVHQRLLGFSISHELEVVRIYGYYPEIGDDGIKYFRWPVKQFNLWTEADKWTCYRFVEKVDRVFLPIHIDRLMHFLEDILDPQDVPFELDADVDISAQSQITSQERSSYTRAPSSQNRGLQPELRSMIQTLQQQLEEQKAREEKQAAEQNAREEKLLAQLEQQRIQMEQQKAEQKAREEKLLAQIEQQGLQLERFLRLLEQNKEPAS
ncbi:hypothetical protein UA08_09490 [Talaromyces atroroseus]|uniref:DUF7924 domain-containing protein n=1 Tax=Talaromyces atroroseus TaxID=1441469 RepID=A0A1Q5Q5Y7_TALAT|nr:hypothetical protein UA08_09490 [Talaromyces atroroseus]OKL55239.1 hypothetical protein UA08_09490 [Talaromyces atroroseus]